TPVSTTPVARQQSALAHFYYSRNWLVKRGETQPQPQLRTQPDSPWLEARGLLARNVEVLLSSARLAWLEKAHCLLLRATGTSESTSEVVRQRLREAYWKQAVHLLQRSLFCFTVQSIHRIYSCVKYLYYLIYFLYGRKYIFLEIWCICTAMMKALVKVRTLHGWALS